MPDLMSVQSTDPEAPRQPGAHVLLVEDDQSVGLSLAAVLELHSSRVTLVTSVALGLQQLREQPFDAVVSDLMLDDELGRTGFAVLAEAARLQPGIVTVLITGYPSAAVMKRAAHDGLTGVLIKPLEIAALLDLLTPAARAESRPP